MDSDGLKAELRTQGLAVDWTSLADGKMPSLLGGVLLNHGSSIANHRKLPSAPSFFIRSIPQPDHSFAKKTGGSFFQPGSGRPDPNLAPTRTV